MSELADVLEILDTLVAIPSVPGRENGAWLDYVAGRLRGAGCQVTIVPSPDASCHGLMATTGPRIAGGLALSGHVDVVSAEGQDWSGDPFRLRQDGPALIGRGVADMKGFVACAIAMMEAATRLPLSRPLCLVLSADEETTCRSAESLAACLAGQPALRGVLVGEPTQLCAVNRHKGSYTCEVEVTGRPAHASLPELGASAIAMAARLIAWLDERSARSNAPDATTHSVGRITGGTASNIIAEHCRFEWDIRLAPGRDLDSVIGALKAEADRLCAPFREQAPEVAVTVRRTASFPGFRTEPDNGFARECLAVSASDAFDEMAAGTEAGLYQAAGFPVIVMGPGDMAQAHTADEQIDRDQLSGCLAQLHRLL